MVGDGAFSHKIDYVGTLQEILNLEGHPNRITGSRDTAILLKGWILSIGEVASGRVCACSLRSRLVLLISNVYGGFFLQRAGLIINIFMLEKVVMVSPTLPRGKS